MTSKKNHDTLMMYENQLHILCELHAEVEKFYIQNVRYSDKEQTYELCFNLDHSPFEKNAKSILDVFKSHNDWKKGGRTDVPNQKHKT